MVRLQKFLAECGVASRRQSEVMISEGRVRVNGAVAGVGDKVDPGKDAVTVDGSPIGVDNKVYLVLNKPRGVITSATDPQGRRTVLDCVTGVDARVFPVGRLDRDVEGVLLLTNDGELAYRLTHPKYQVDKVYKAWVHGRFNAAAARAMQEGVELEDGLATAAKVDVLRQRKDATLVRLVMREGRKREVKRLCEAAGYPVRSLIRTAIGNVTAQGLQPGEWRYLKERELADLRRITGLEP